MKLRVNSFDMCMVLTRDAYLVISTHDSDMQGIFLEI